MSALAFEFDSEQQVFAERRFTLPEVLRPGEVLIRVTCCTICGSDLHTFCGRRSAPKSCVLGHEIIGTVENWCGHDPPNDFHGNRLSKGQRVTWAMAVGCGDCFFCERGISQKCESLFKYGHQSPSGMVPTGGLSEYCVLVPGTPIFQIPDSLSDEVASPANCATATVAAALRLVAESQAIQNSSVLIVGAGMLGLTAAAMLNDAGAKQIFLTDNLNERLQWGASFGATHCLQSGESERLFELIEAETTGRGVDIALDFAGALSAVETAVNSLRIGGYALLAGSVFPMQDFSISPETIVRKMLTIRGLHNYSVNDLDNAIKFLERAQTDYPFHDLVGETFPLELTPEAFECAHKQRPIRVAIKSPG